MPTVYEGGTVVVIAEILDEDGASVVPDNIRYCLTDENGNVINSLSAVSVVTAATAAIVLSGADLPFTGTEGEREKDIYLRIKAEYTSATYGTGLTAITESALTVSNTRCD